MKAHELADKAKELVDKNQPLSAIIASSIDMAEWADRTMLDKVCEWLDAVLYDYVELKHANVNTNVKIHCDKLIEDLRKAMESE